MKDGELVAERYADGFDAETRQLGWSMSKSVTDLLTGVLVERGVVTLDDATCDPSGPTSAPTSPSSTCCA